MIVRVEAPKGELGIYLVGDDSLFPWRWKIRPPGFINLQILPQLVCLNKLERLLTGRPAPRLVTNTSLGRKSL
jgi:NAD(P)H-quinone oxidoreductase subunit H